MQNTSDATLTHCAEAISALAESPNSSNLRLVQNLLESRNVSEHTYLAKMLQHTLAESLVTDFAERIGQTSGEGSDHVRAVLRLHGMVAEIEGFSDMPPFDSIYEDSSPVGCNMTTQYIFHRPILDCASDTEAEHIHRMIIEVIDKRPEDKAPIAFHLTTFIRKELLNSGMRLIGESLNDIEQLRYDIYILAASMPENELPLFLPSLNLVGKQPKAVLPRDIAAAQTIEEIEQAIHSLQYCYNVLSPKCFSEQMLLLQSSLGERLSKELLIAVYAHDFELPDELMHKLSILSGDLKEKLMELKEIEPQRNPDIEDFADIIGLVHGLCIAGDDDTAMQISKELFERYSLLNGNYYRYFYELTAQHLTGYVLANVVAVISDAGYALSDVTMTKIMIYYAMMFAGSNGEIAFWKTDIYRLLMAQVDR